MATVPAGPAVLRVPRNYRRWSDSENKKIVEHLLSTVRQGKLIEKPNAIAYYQAAHKKLKFDDCSVNQLQNQSRNLRKPYIKAVDWRSQTGQGVLENEGEASVKGKDENKFRISRL
jgi:hypothetical protein